MADRWYEASYNGQATTGKTLKLHVYTVETNINDNWTTERADLWLSVTNGTGGNYNNYGSECFIGINYNDVTRSVPFNAVAVGDKLLIGTWDTRVYHEADGSKTIGVSAHHYSGVALGNASISANYVCDTIPRASNISLSRTDITFWQHSIIYTNRRSTEFTHNIFLYYNSDAAITVATGVTNDFLFKSGDYPQLYERIPNSKSSTGQFMLRTFKGNQIIGETITPFTLRLPADGFVPIFNDFDYVTDSTSTQLTGNNKTVIKDITNLTVNISTANKAVAQKSATMKNYNVQVGNKSANINYSSTANVSATLNKVNNKIINVYAIDSRGFTTQKQKQVNKFIEYTPIVISNATITRDNGGTGTEVTLKYNGSIWNANFGSVTNVITSVKYQYRVVGSNTWIDGTSSITPVLSGNSFSFNGKIAGDKNALGFNMANSYEIRILINDKLTGYTFPLNGSLILMSGVPGIAFGKSGVAFGSPYDESLGGLLQINGKRVDAIDITEQYTTKFTKINFEVLYYQLDNKIEIRLAFDEIKKGGWQTLAIPTNSKFKNVKGFQTGGYGSEGAFTPLRITDSGEIQSYDTTGNTTFASGFISARLKDEKESGVNE